MLGWKDEPVVPLSNCIISTTDYNSSNCCTHFRNKHKALLHELSADVPNVNSSVVATSSQPSLKQHLISQYGQKNCIASVASSNTALAFLYSFFNNANVAIHQANNPNLTKFIDYILEHATQFRYKPSDCHFSRWKYQKQRDLRFANFIVTLKNIITYTRDYYNERLNKTNTPFLCVSHDGWDSKDNDVLGVSVHLVVPAGHWKTVHLAVGLKRVTSKKSQHGRCNISYFKSVSLNY